MQLIKYSIASFISVFILALTSQASVALTIVPNQPGATRYSRPISDGELGNGYIGITQVERIDLLPLGGSKKLKNELLLWSALSEFGFLAWNFKSAQRELTGNFEVEKYLACNVDDFCGEEGGTISDIANYSKRDGVGASFRLLYNPGFIDPQSGQKRIHWIQMARASFAAGRRGSVSNTWFIDNNLRRDNPYYDTVGDASEDYFVDVPYNPNLAEARKNQYFEAELHLVEDTSPQVSLIREVRIYNGIRWGFRSTAVRECAVSSSSGGACPPPPSPPSPPSPPPPPPPPPPLPQPQNCSVSGILCTITYEVVTDNEFGEEYKPGECWNYYLDGWSYQPCNLGSGLWKLTATTSFIYDSKSNNIPPPLAYYDNYNWKLVEVRAANINQNKNQLRLVNFNINSDDVSTSVQSVAEPNYLFSVMAFWASSTILWFKKLKGK